MGTLTVNPPIMGTAGHPDISIPTAGHPDISITNVGTTGHPDISTPQ